MNKTLVSDAVVCIHEDRLSHLIGLKLAVLSLQTYCPKLEIIVSCPNPPIELTNWINTLSNIKIISHLQLGNVGWNIKPLLILELLETGYDNVIWLDSDIIVNGKILATIAEYNADTLVVTEEPYWGQSQGGSFRTLAWGLPLGRQFKCTVNSGVIRATYKHIHLLKAWVIMLNHPTYLKTQKMPSLDRPLHMIGDQEVLTALICSEDFKNIPTVMLKRGVDIAQCFGAAGYTPTERLKNIILFRTPSLFHAMGAKPWNKTSNPPHFLNKSNKFLKNLKTYYEYLTLELTPYTVIARKYQKTENARDDWMLNKSLLAKTLEFLAFNNPNLIGLPLAVLDSFGKFLKRSLGIDRYSRSTEYMLKESPFSYKK